MKLYLCALMLFFNAVAGLGQVTGPGAEIGDLLPDLTLKNVINSRTPVINTADYKGKFLILDFWATWCTPCVASIPKLDSLQKKFDRELQILPITYQDSATVLKLFQKNRQIQNSILPFVTSDNALRFLFPHKLLPHYVWVNQMGKVVAITGGNEVNVDNITKAITGIQSSFNLKKESNLPYESEHGFLFQELGFDESDVVFQSLLAKYKDGLGSRMQVIQYKNEKTTWRPKRITFSNTRIMSFFQFAWGGMSDRFKDKLVVIESMDSLKIRGPVDGTREEYVDFFKRYSFCYELIFPNQDSVDVFEIMRSDIARYFPKYLAVVEKREVRCLVLERTSSIDKLKASGGKFSYQADPYGMRFNNASIGVLVSHLNYLMQNQKLPIVDGTSYKEKIDINLQNINVLDVLSLNEGFRKFDLQLVEKNYVLDVLIIRDR